jgi:hypothetical protein
VKITVGSIAKTTNVIKNTENPVWNEKLNLGFLGSATQLKIEIWDKNIGLQYPDKITYSSNLRVPFCSTMNANYSTVNCGTPFGCSSGESLWEMPLRQVINKLLYNIYMYLQYLFNVIRIIWSKDFFLIF